MRLLCLSFLRAKQTCRETESKGWVAWRIPAEDAGDSRRVRDGCVGIGDDCGAVRLLDELVRELVAASGRTGTGRLASGIALAAVGGYGRQELFPYSDVDLLFLLDGRVAEKDVKDVIRRLNQEMWDCGIRVAPTTRKIGECERFTEENAEFTVSLMDHRMLAGDTGLYDKLAVQTLPKLLQREQKPLTAHDCDADTSAATERIRYT